MPLLKEKIGENIKVIACANEPNQRGHINQEETTSEDYPLEPVLLISEIEANEGSNVAVTDFRRKYLVTDIDAEVLMVLMGNFSKIWIILYPVLYQMNVVTNEYGKMVFYTGI